MFASDLPDNYQPTSYSEEFLRSTHAHTDPSTEQPEYSSNDRYGQTSTLNQESSSNNHHHHPDDNYGTQAGHRTTTTDYQPHHVSIFL